MREIVLVRHGQTEWSAAGRHTSFTDLPLTPEGERQAARLAELLAGRAFAAVLCSPLQRAVRTAQLAGLDVTALDDDLLEWNYGAYEGRTTPDIREQRADWSLWDQGCPGPGGETAQLVGARADRVLERARTMLTAGDVALVGHAHQLRVLTARWLGLPPQGGALFRLETGTLSVLGFERETPVLLRWNL
ncbi:histidine phosphatase family protein [Catellatospora bangladeshensis]|uniref:Phosphoglycerate mutase n=1 Tax=Catellatospora bangladeshensis TaxID=310355 RepID=A0A8J3NHV8_9ACTN|nr:MULTISPECIES: histidine phosphatase family protein [Catellatospora]BCJ75560.1 phosphoglycerate mutase [Catellatospora sp. IY07-71]GIF80218.1 phosphoglycerate mutase [Catellatospora bangladeshensis]